MKSLMYRLGMPLFVAAMAAFGAQARDMVATDVANSVRASFPNTKIDSIRLSEIPGLLEITMGRNIAYVYPGLPYILVGSIYDTRNGKDLTAERAQMLTPRVSWQDLPLTDAIRRGTGSKKIAVFTDPDCPYCKRLENELAKLRDVEIYIFMNPVPDLHPGAVSKAKAVWCSPNRLKAWDDLMSGKSPEGKPDCNASAVDRNIELAKRLGFRGTPVMVREDGDVIEGLRPARVLAGWLGVPWIETVSGPAEAKAEPNAEKMDKTSQVKRGGK